MARFTASHAELVHLASIQKELPIAGIMEAKLIDGRTFEGVIRRASFGNNAGEGGIWRYYGEYEIQGIDGQHWVIDVLDISSANSAPPTRLDAYVAAGIIKIVDYPPAH